MSIILSIRTQPRKLITHTAFFEAAVRFPSSLVVRVPLTTPLAFSSRDEPVPLLTAAFP